jgi:hypothetical protein
MTNGASHRFIVNRHDAGRSGDAEIEETINELIGQFGKQRVRLAILQSKLGEDFEKLGASGTLRVIQQTLREIVFSPDPQLEAEVMALGAGVLLENHQSMRTIGAKHGISWQAVSKRVVAFVMKWDLPPSVYMRSEKDRETYAMCNKPRVT